VDLTWAGSLTGHEADCRVYGNGNAVITHEPCERTGSERVLAETSRYTPPIMDANTADIGLRFDDEAGVFIGKTISTAGRVDIFDNDFVLRAPLRHLRTDEPVTVRVRSIDTEIIDDSLQGALSVGPMLTETDFENHPINRDLSLGGKPPFVNRRMARLMLYATEDNVTHMRLFDGRPDSNRFTGVTPQEAVDIVGREAALRWGCFLDPGQTAKLYVQDPEDGIRMNFGNRHYLKWPMNEDEHYTWVPDLGRPVASAIVLS
jgi:hypothetical protein